MPPWPTSIEWVWHNAMDGMHGMHGMKCVVGWVSVEGGFDHDVCCRVVFRVGRYIWI